MKSIKITKNPYIGCCQTLLNDIGIKSEYVDFIAQDLHCDYYGFNEECHIIVEYKTSISDAQKGIMQLLNYYDSLKRSKRWKNHSNPIKLILYYDGVDFIKFGRQHTLYRDYLANENCPKIDFCYYDGSELIYIKS